MLPDPPYKIIIVGHSYVHWLCSFVETPYHGSGFADFVVDGCRCDVDVDVCGGWLSMRCRCRCLWWMAVDAMSM